MEYIIIYVIGIAITLLVNAFIAGYNGNNITLNDFSDAVIWPISLTVLIGLLIRLVVEKNKKQLKDENGKQ